VTVVPTVPGSGLVITGISVTPTLDYEVGRTYQIRLMQNTTTQVGHWGFKEGANQRWLANAGVALGTNVPAQSVDLGNGVPIPKGVPLTVQANAKFGAIPLSVTITGYVW